MAGHISPWPTLKQQFIYAYMGVMYAREQRGLGAPVGGGAQPGSPPKRAAGAQPRGVRGARFVLKGNELSRIREMGRLG